MTHPTALHVGDETTITGTVRTIEALHPDGHYRVTVDVDATQTNRPTMTPPANRPTDHLGDPDGQ